MRCSKAIEAPNMTTTLCSLRSFLWGLSILVGVSGAVCAQDVVKPGQERQDWEIVSGGKMEFEVAAIKLGDLEKFTPPTVPLSIEDDPVPAGNRFVADFPLVAYIEFAYKIMLTREERELMLSRVPKWVGSKPFFIEAKTPAGDHTKDQLRLMMQSLLVDRFKLAVHFETQEIPVFALTAH